MPELARDHSLKLVFDHITVLAKSLEEGAAYIRASLGIDMPPGGDHPRMGTHNQLLSLGPDCFLEVIAIDPKARRPDRPRWFGLDDFDDEPRIGAWVLGSSNISAALAGSQENASPIVEMTRGDLKWLMSIRDDGKLPLAGAFPKLLQWPTGPHVASKMENRGCTFVSLTVSHPQADAISSWLNDKLDDPRITFEAGPARLTSKIKTSAGLKTLS